MGSDYIAQLGLDSGREARAAGALENLSRGAAGLLVALTSLEEQGVELLGRLRTFQETSQAAALELADALPNKEYADLTEPATEASGAIDALNRFLRTQQAAAREEALNRLNAAREMIRLLLGRLR